MERTSRSHYEMPAWDGWSAKFLKGLGIGVVGLLYMIVPALLLSATGLWSSVSAQTMATGFNPIGIAGMGTAALISMILFMFLAFLIPMAIAKFAATGDFVAAFRFGEIIRHIVAAPASYVATFVLAIALYALVSFLNAVPYLGWLLTVFAYFYVTVVVAALFGAVYQKSLAGTSH
ncbi:MAG: DUF4013 domain-containing protein, partial [Clostridia bacterium]|nr:DUF4013 domain-containing protein [Clostridia bacterium]